MDVATLGAAQAYAKELVAGASNLTDLAGTAVQKYINGATNLVTDDNVGSKINDYLTKDNSVSGAIVNTVSGQAIYVDDASDKKIQGLSIYGRTTQDGTPSVDAPVEIVTEIAGETEIGVYGRNLFVMEDCETYNNGITFACKDGVITVNGTPTADYAVMLEKAYLTLPKGTYQRIVRENNITLIVRALNADGTYTYLSSPLELQETTKVEAYVQITQQVGVTFTNATIKPYIMLSEGAWEQGIKQSMTVTLPSLNGIPVDSGGNHTDADGQQWICDEINFERGVYVQNVKKIKLTEITNFNTNEQFGGIAVSDVLQTGSRVKILADRFLFNAAIKADGVAFAYANEIRLYKTCEGVEDFNNWLAEVNGVDIIYPLATPIETPLTDTQIEAYKALYSNKPITTVLNSEVAEMTVKYIADTKTYIDNKFDELSKAIVALAE